MKKMSLKLSSTFYTLTLSACLTFAAVMVFTTTTYTSEKDTILSGLAEIKYLMLSVAEWQVKWHTAENNSEKVEQWQRAYDTIAETEGAEYLSLEEAYLLARNEQDSVVKGEWEVVYEYLQLREALLLFHADLFVVR